MSSPCFHQFLRECGGLPRSFHPFARHPQGASTREDLENAFPVEEWPHFFIHTDGVVHKPAVQKIKDFK